MPIQALAPVQDLTELDQITAAVTSLPALPFGTGTRYGPRPLTAAWLASMGSRHTRRAYFADLTDLLAWCDLHGVDPLAARRADLDAYRAGLVDRLADRTIARRLAALSSWYAYLLDNQRPEDDGPVLAGNPASSVRRPKVARLRSPTVGLTPTEVAAVLQQADVACEQRRAVYHRQPTPGRRVRYLAAARDRALMRTLAGLGLRVGEAIALDVSSQSYNRGHRTIRYIGKGGIPRERVLPAHALEALDEYLTIRAALTGVDRDALTGPLFATTNTTGDPGRLDEPAIFRHIQRLAQHAGLPVAIGCRPTRYGTRSPPPPARKASPSKTSKTPWTTPTHAPPAATTATATTSTATLPSPSAPATLASSGAAGQRTPARTRRDLRQRRQIAVGVDHGAGHVVGYVTACCCFTARGPPGR